MKDVRQSSALLYLVAVIREGRSLKVRLTG